MYLGIDLGSSFIKFACMDSENSIMHHIKRAFTVRINTCSSSKYEYDINYIIKKIEHYINEAMALYSIEGIIFSTQMHGFILRNNKKS
jgi:sugar (pentulose or hexulose) kinase